MGRGRGRRSSRVESWLQGMAITHQRPGQPASLCALRNPPVPGHRPWPRGSGLEEELGSCVGRAGAGGPDPGGLPGGRGVEPGRRGAQRQQVKRFGLSGGKKGRGWRDQWLTGEGVEPLRCQTQPPDGVSWRGWGKGPLPATMAILGPESNQIRRSPPFPPHKPPAAAQNSCPATEGEGRLEPRFLPPTHLPTAQGCAARGRERALGSRQKPGLPLPRAVPRLRLRRASLCSFLHIPP